MCEQTCNTPIRLQDSEQKVNATTVALCWGRICDGVVCSYAWMRARARSLGTSQAVVPQPMWPWEERVAQVERMPSLTASHGVALPPIRVSPLLRPTLACARKVFVARGQMCEHTNRFLLKLRLNQLHRICDLHKCCFNILHLMRLSGKSYSTIYSHCVPLDYNRLG